jgi:hypothetical protein
MSFGFSKEGGQVYGIFHNASGNGPEWQLYEVSVTTKGEKLLVPVDLPPSTASVGELRISPDGKRALTSIPKFPYQIWMLEGFEPPRAKNWFAGLVKRR